MTITEDGAIPLRPGPDSVVLTKFLDCRAVLFSKDFARSIQPEIYENDNILEDTVLVLDGAQHRRRRAVENRLFRTDDLAAYEREEYRTRLAELLPLFINRGRTDVVSMAGAIAMYTSAKLSGIDITDPQRDLNRLVELDHVFNAGAGIDDSTRNLSALKSEVQTALREFETEYYASSYAKRQVCPHNDDVKSGPPRHDLVCSLQMSAKELGMSDGAIFRETAFYLESGAHTSGHSVTAAIHYLLSWFTAHPDDRAKLKEDLSAVQRAVFEAVRLRPVIPLMKRRALRDVTVGGVQVKSDDVVFLDIEKANRDPEVFGHDAKDFNLDRRVEDPYFPYGLAFGGGIHTCIGKNLAVGLAKHRDETNALKQMGLIPILVQELLKMNVQPDCEEPPVTLKGTLKANRWQSYPVLIDNPPCGHMQADG